MQILAKNLTVYLDRFLVNFLNMYTFILCLISFQVMTKIVFTKNCESGTILKGMSIPWVFIKQLMYYGGNGIKCNAL